MSELRLGFRAFDPHELLVHFVAERLGLYEELELRVELVDLREGARSHHATCACGTALFEALADTRIEIRLIASAAPLFWLLGRTAELDGPRIATFPPGSAPARFLELAVAGEATFVPARDDAARLRLVHSGEADCALLSSATPPKRVNGLRQIFCLADRVHVPSTGLAAPHECHPALERLVTAHRRALALLAHERHLGYDVVQDAFGYDDEESRWVLNVAERYFTSDGRVPSAYVEAALRTVGASHSPYATGAVSTDDRIVNG